MLKSERAGFVRVAVEAHLVLRCGGTKLIGQKTAVLVMAIAAGDQSFIDTMVERTRKVRFHSEVTAIAELRLRGLQKTPFDSRLMNRMATDAAYIVLQMLRPHEIAVFFAEFMAIETPAADIRRRQLVETDDLGNITAALDVGSAGPVACFTTLPRRSAALLKLVLPVRPMVVALGLRVVTRGTDVTAGV
jgi:hypothetical protein